MSLVKDCRGGELTGFGAFFFGKEENKNKQTNPALIDTLQEEKILILII